MLVLIFIGMMNIFGSKPTGDCFCYGEAEKTIYCFEIKDHPKWLPSKFEFIQADTDSNGVFETTFICENKKMKELQTQEMPFKVHISKVNISGRNIERCGFNFEYVVAPVAPKDTAKSLTSAQ